MSISSILGPKGVSAQRHSNDEAHPQQLPWPRPSRASADRKHLTDESRANNRRSSEKGAFPQGLGLSLAVFDCLADPGQRPSASVEQGSACRGDSP